jgi:hypothetical protein
MLTNLIKRLIKFYKALVNKSGFVNPRCAFQICNNAVSECVNSYCFYSCWRSFYAGHQVFLLRKRRDEAGKTASLKAQATCNNPPEGGLLQHLLTRPTLLLFALFACPCTAVARYGK